MDHNARTNGAIAVAFAVAVFACAAPPDRPAESGSEPGAPFPGLESADLVRFASGKALFDRVFTPAEGLGPAFNENQCSACHTDPASGGTGEQRVLKATRFDSVSGTCDRLEQAGGLNVRSQATPALKAAGITRETVPREATARGRFSPPFLFGAGLVEAIPDSVILSREDSADRDGDGISGRAGRTADGRLARFGRKAEFATLVEFISGALRLEMGLTSPLEPVEARVNGRPLPRGTDPARDPEVDSTSLNALRDYVRLLAPLPPEGVSEDARDSVDQGRRLFHALRCASCHVPAMVTGPSAVSALDRRSVSLYSDLLLHDMGGGLADICGLTAQPSEVRTEPLAGLRYREAFLHDGRAHTVGDAIHQHGGEARRAREAFTLRGASEQVLLLRFLETL